MYLGSYDAFKNPHKDEYNLIPVYYCKHCLSLKINGEIEDSDYCEDCYNTEIETSTIEEWQELFKARYGHYYLDKK